MPRCPNLQLCLGIDPNPANFTYSEFQSCVENHTSFLKKNHRLLSHKILKPQLAFFLAHGSKGIGLLEEFVSDFKDEFTIILDGKFNEIANSLKAYLNFVFLTLGAHGVTINPFLGEKTLSMTFEMCAKQVGAKGRVYVLCATSESSQSTLSYLQENWRTQLLACEKTRDQVFSSQNELKKIAGVVIGANKQNILFSPELQSSGLSVLSPGLGVQGGDFNILTQCHGLPNEFVFPLSRSIFGGGTLSQAQIQENLLLVNQYF